MFAWDRIGGGCRTVAGLVLSTNDQTLEVRERMGVTLQRMQLFAPLTCAFSLFCVYKGGASEGTGRYYVQIRASTAEEAGTQTRGSDNYKGVTTSFCKYCRC